MLQARIAFGPRLSSGLGASLLLLAACSERADTEPARVLDEAWPPFTVRGTWGARTSITYAVDDTHSPLPQGTLREAVHAAADLWNGLGGPQLVEAPAEDLPDVRYAWGQAATDSEPDAPFGRDTSVALTGLPGPGCEVLFDASRPWRIEVGPPGDPVASLLQATAHETGHVLGLGHSPDPHALLYAQRETGIAAPMRSDLRGLNALYGTSAPEPGDLVVSRASGEPLVVLAGCAPDTTAWDVLDTDGDGDSEIVVWDVDGRHTGAWMAYHFGADPAALAGSEPRLLETRGPHLGVSGPGAALSAGASGDALGLWVAGDTPNRVVQRSFDAQGHLGTGVRGALPTGTRRLGGRDRVETDLDGDGVTEIVARTAHE